jgi:hypothetical protein
VRRSTVTDDDLIRRWLDERPGDWRAWARVDELGALTPEGLDAVEWAAGVVADFYGDDWFRRNLDRFPNPLFSIYDHPLSHGIAAVRHIERAARIALLPPTVREALCDGRNGIRHSDSWNDFDHLDVVLELVGLALRDGWQVECEVLTERGRLPDLRVSRSGFAYSIEVTTQGFDSLTRKEGKQSELLRDHQLRIEIGRGVDCATRLERLLSDAELVTFVAELDRAAVTTATKGAPTEFDLGYASASVHPRGERPGTTSYEGPILGVDLWPRFATRLREKAEQLADGGRGWIRIDEGGGLMAFTSVYHLPPEEQLGLLVHRIAESLAEYHYVQGVIMSHGAGPDWMPLAREFGLAERVSGSSVLELRLPGSRRRRTYIVRLPRRGLVLPEQLVVDPARWYRNEASWLDWALQQLDMARLESLVRSESIRRLLP